VTTYQIPTRDPRGWVADAGCVGEEPAVFFAQSGPKLEAAKEICAGCPVRTDCLEHALEERYEYGTWAGMTGRERRALIRERELAADPTPRPECALEDCEAPVPATARTNQRFCCAEHAQTAARRAYEKRNRAARTARDNERRGVRKRPRSRNTPIVQEAS